MTDIVRDNSVTMRWCFEGGNHDYANKILQQLSATGDTAIVPVLGRYEVSAVPARAEIKRLLTPQIRTRGLPAYGSYLGCLTAKRPNKSQDFWKYPHR